MRMRSASIPSPRPSPRPDRPAIHAAEPRLYQRRRPRPGATGSLDHSTFEDEWGAASERFIPQCIVPLWPPEAMVAEIRRSIGNGHRGVVFPGVPMELREVPYLGEPAWDPVWNVCEELDVPLCLHAGGSQQ